MSKPKKSKKSKKSDKRTTPKRSISKAGQATGKAKSSSEADELDVVIDPKSERQKEEKTKKTGTKLVDGGTCGGLA